MAELPREAKQAEHAASSRRQDLLALFGFSFGAQRKGHYCKDSHQHGARPNVTRILQASTKPRTRRKNTLHFSLSSAMPLSSIVAAVGKNSKNAVGTLAVVPLVLTSAGITSYARYAATHTDSKTSSAAEHEHEREEQLHQHVALAWKGAR